MASRPAGPVGQLGGQGAAQHPGRYRVGGDGRQPESLSCRAAHPAPEPVVADGEGEPPEEQGSGLGIVAELPGQLDGPGDGLDDHPLVS